MSILDDDQGTVNSRSAKEFPIHTSQEIDAINRASANGKSFNGYAPEYNSSRHEDLFSFRHEDLAHWVQLSETHENADECGMDYLEKLIRAQDSDAVIAQLYILGVLAPPPGSVFKNTTAHGWIDFDDVIEKIGWSPRSTMQRREMHSRIWQFIKFGERAQIVGERSKSYNEPHSKKKIETRIEASVWRVHGVRKVDQGELPFSDSVPIAAEIIISPAIASLITSPLTAQFLPMGEVLGMIPGNKPSGAWARVIGLSLASFWRRNPQKSLNMEFKPSREELLTHYPPKVAPIEEVLASQNNGRAIEYWCEALAILVKSGILSREGEALRTAKEIRAAMPPRDWWDEWLGERVHLMPGEEMKGHIEGRARAIEERRPMRRKPKAFKPRKKS